MVKDSVVFKILFVLFSFSFLSCAQEIVKKKVSVTIPPQLDDGLTIGSLYQAKIDSLLLLKLLEKIDTKEYERIHSILIVKDSRLIFEQYFPGYDFKYEAKDFNGDFVEYDHDKIHNLASVTKSITSMLCGIAIDKGLIKNTDENLFTFFPKYSVLFDSMKKDIKLFHLLTMSSGLNWNEQDIPYSNIQNDIIQLFITQNPETYILSKPLSSKPGTKFYYNGGGTNLIGRIIQNTSGEQLDVFAEKYLFEPLGIKQARWVFVKPGFVYASGDLRISPRDMAKLGFLVLNKGMWHNHQVVSTKWIEQMIEENVHFPNGDGYGYQWWIKKYSGTIELNCFAASGWGGQNILIFPELNSVIVITGGNYFAKSPNEEILNRYILPAIEPGFDYDYKKIKSEAPLPDDLVISTPENKNNAFLSGIWFGKWEYTLPTQLAIEKIENDSLHIIYSWPNHPDGYFKKGWMRKTAWVDKSGRFNFSEGDAEWQYIYEKGEDLLIGFYKNPYVNDKVIMKRKK